MNLSIDISLCSSFQTPNILKYLSLGDKNENSLTNPSLIDNINTALRVIMLSINNKNIYQIARAYRQKLIKFINDGSHFNPTTFENKMLLNHLWHFLNSIPLDYFEFEEEEFYDSNSYEELFEDKILLDDWLEQFKNLIKQIAILVEETKIKLTYDHSLKKQSFEHRLYFTLQDLQVNTIVSKHKTIIDNLLSEMTNNHSFEAKNANFHYYSSRKNTNNPDFLKKVNLFLQSIRIDDFQLITSSSDTHNENTIDFYEWWADFKLLEKNIISLHEEIHNYNNTLEEFYG